MQVFLASPLLPYTGSREVEAAGGTLAEVMADLDRRYPGIRFRMIDEQDRIRRHMRMFVNGVQTFDLGLPLAPDDRLSIVQALSGG